MKIERSLIETIDIATFADRHQLVMTVKERPCDGEDRFYASFKGVEIMDGGCLVSAFENGASEDEAIGKYAKRLSLQRIAVFGNNVNDRRNIDVPRLTYTVSESV